jgi:hypothetical protein
MSWKIEYHCQNWELINYMIEGEWIIIEMGRDIDPNDPQDHRIIDNSSPYAPGTRLIAAWERGNDFGFHGSNVARSVVELFESRDSIGACP